MNQEQINELSTLIHLLEVLSNQPMGMIDTELIDKVH